MGIFKEKGKSKGENGIALLEVVAVGLILGFLVGVLAPAVSKAILKGICARLEGDLLAIQKAIEFYFVDTGGYPASNQVGSCIQFSDQFEDLVQNPGISGWDGPYVDKRVQKFGGVEYQVHCTYSGNVNWEDLEMYAQLVTVSGFPAQMTIQLDRDLDDGDPLTGRVQYDMANKVVVVGVVVPANPPAEEAPPPPP